MRIFLYIFGLVSIILCFILFAVVGALHCLAVTDAGQVFAWGDNDHGQQGNGTTQVNRRPSLGPTFYLFFLLRGLLITS